jgi:hypothetical protein
VKQAANLIKIRSGIHARASEGANVVTGIPGVVADRVDARSTAGQGVHGFSLPANTNAKVVSASRLALVVLVFRFVQRVHPLGVRFVLELLIRRNSISWWDGHGP